MKQTGRAQNVVPLEESSERARLLETARQVNTSDVDSWEEDRMVAEKDLLVAEGNRLGMSDHHEVANAVRKLIATLNRGWR